MVGGADANERRDAGAHAGKEEDERGGYVVTASGVGTPIDDADEENYSCPSTWTTEEEEEEEEEEKEERN